MPVPIRSPQFKLGDYVVSKCEQKRREVFPDFESRPTIYQILSIRIEVSHGGTDIAYLLCGGDENCVPGQYLSVDEDELLPVSAVHEKED